MLIYCAYICMYFVALNDILMGIFFKYQKKKIMDMLQCNDTRVTYLIYSDVYVLIIDQFNMLNR